MEYKRFGNKIVVRMDMGEEILEQLKAVALKENIKLCSVSALGATNDFTVGVYDVDKKFYKANSFKGPHEIVSLTGSVNTMNGEFYSHIHMAAADGEALMASPTAAVADLAAESFRAIGASACGDTFAALASLLKDAAHADRTVLAEAEQAFRQAVQTECPLTLCESYIGEHADEFIDPPPSETV